MKRRSFNQLFKDFYRGYKVMVDKYPKAARKRRIIKKWKKRFGPDHTELMREAMSGGNYLLKHIKKDLPWAGVTLPIPMPGWEGGENE